MKIFRTLLGAFGFSTFHLHNNPPLRSSSLSKVEPPVQGKNLFSIAVATPLSQHEQAKEIEFKVIPFIKDDPLPPPIISKKTNRTFTRPPRTIKATKKPNHPQPRQRRW